MRPPDPRLADGTERRRARGHIEQPLVPKSSVCGSGAITTNRTGESIGSRRENKRRYVSRLRCAPFRVRRHGCELRTTFVPRLCLASANIQLQRGDNMTFIAQFAIAACVATLVTME